jgi:hypothetical protein
VSQASTAAAEAEAVYTVGLNEVVSQKIDEERYEYSKSVSMHFRTTGSVTVEASNGEKPSGRLVAMFAETTGILDTGTATEFFDIAVMEGKGRFTIRERESYSLNGSVPSGVPKYEFRKFAFEPFKKFDAPPSAEKPDTNLNLVAFEASPQRIVTSPDGEWYYGRTDLEVTGESALKGKTFTAFIAQETLKSNDAAEVGDIALLALPVIDGRYAGTQNRLITSANNYKGEDEPTPSADEYGWKIVGYSDELVATVMQSGEAANK